jgi:hypothetical protein
MASHLLGFDDVIDINIDDKQNHLKVQSKEPEKFYQNLVAAIVENGFNVTYIDSPDDNLQSVFKYLVK